MVMTQVDELKKAIGMLEEILEKFKNLPLNMIYQINEVIAEAKKKLSP